MTAKVNLKTILVLVILLLVGVLGVLGMSTVRTLVGSAAAGVEPKNVIVKPEVVTENGREEFVAQVEWTTEKPAMSIVEYGTTPASLLLRLAESEQSTNHSVKLSPLKSNTSYYLRIRVGDEVFDNNGIPYSFKTKESGSGGGALAPTVAPVVGNSTPVINEAGCNRTTDYNQDGVVNSLDYIKCSSGQVVPTGGSECKTGVDFDGNGVVNSLDMIKCLQNKQS